MSIKIGGLLRSSKRTTPGRRRTVAYGSISDLGT